jgi:uncharacterized protein YbjT (DUF2867 family)
VGAYFDVAASISDIRLLLRVKSLPKSPDSRRVFIAGGTGYIGSALLPILLERGHRARVLVRPGSKAQLPAECEVVSGNPLDANSYRQLIRPADTFIHLVGVAHPARAKTAAFRSIDLASTREAVSACGELGVQQFIYLSVAHPAPLGIMKNYVAVRAECEKMIQERMLNCSILRPWYVLGPGRRWPYLLLPFYKVCEWLPFARGAALRLGLVTLDELILALIDAVESPVRGTRIIEVPAIRDAGVRLSRQGARQTA